MFFFFWEKNSEKSPDDDDDDVVEMGKNSFASRCFSMGLHLVDRLIGNYLRQLRVLLCVEGAHHVSTS